MLIKRRIPGYNPHAALGRAPASRPADELLIAGRRSSAGHETPGISNLGRVGHRNCNVFLGPGPQSAKLIFGQRSHHFRGGAENH